jgi:hypothetical protein
VYDLPLLMFQDEHPGVGACEGGEDRQGQGRRVKNSSAGIQGLRKRCTGGTQHLVTEILSSWQSRAVMIGMCRSVQSVELQHAQDVNQGKTARGRKEVNIARATGRMWGYVLQVFDWLKDESCLIDMGLLAHDDSRTTTLLDQESGQRVVDVVLNFSRVLVQHEASFLRRYTVTPPGMFFAAISDNEAERKAAFRKMGLLWERLERYELHGEGVEMELRHMEWPELQWCREVLLAHAECLHERLPSMIQAEVDFAAREVFGSKCIEDLFAVVRDFEQAVNNRRMGTPSVFHELIENGVLEDSGLSPICVLEQDRVCSKGTVPEQFFKARDAESRFRWATRRSRPSTRRSSSPASPAICAYHSARRR